jgi:photosystem I P700 chlorophyll a apoprotein A1
MKNSHLNTNSQIFSISINLFLLGLSSLIHGYHSYALPTYPYVCPDFLSVLSLIYHHIILAGLLIIGSASHLSMFVIGDWALTKDNIFLILLFSSRDLILGCLVYIIIILGFHSFSIYIHNDTLSALGRQEDMFQDHSIQLKPFFANITYSCFRILTTDSSNIIFSDKKVTLIFQELGTADLIVNHIHGFTCHTTLFIILKGILYARRSRLLSVKLELGWIYPCDGPGRGGTCQISAYDHIYLAAFWVYNCISVVLFHYFWKEVSDIWG